MRRPTIFAACLAVLLLASLCGPALADPDPSTPTAPAFGDATNPITVWVVPISHDDVIWLRTFAEYFSWNVQFIISSYVDALLANPDRRFVQAEQGFFRQWWLQQSDARKDQVRRLASSGQLVFWESGPSMPDGATVTFSSVLEGLETGHDFLLDELGVKPRVASHIDPFGHPSSLAVVYNHSGMNTWILNRIDFRAKNALYQSQGLEYVWQPSPSLGRSSTLFAHILDHHYCSPPATSNFEYGYYGSGDVVVPHSIVPSTPDNVQKFADEIYFTAMSRAPYFRTPHVLIPQGCDFQFQNAMMQFNQMELIMDYIRANPERYNNTRIRWSNVEDFVAAVQDYVASHGVQMPTYSGDWFPYADNSASYWTGYFSSKMYFKVASRYAEAYMRTAESLLASAFFTGRNALSLDLMMHNITELRQAHGISLHHDATTGTAKRIPTEDTLTMLIQAEQNTEGVAASSLRQLLAHNPKDPFISQFASLQLAFDASVASRLRTGELVPVVVSNALGYSRHTPVELTLPASLSSLAQFSVVDANMMPVQSQLSLYPGGWRTLSFVALVPSVGSTTYFLQARASADAAAAVAVPSQKIPAGSVLENEYLRVLLDPFGRPTQLLNKASGVSQRLSVEIRAYNSSENWHQPSGAYIFRPAQPASDLLCPQSVVSPASFIDSSLVTGPLFDMVVVDYTRCVGYNATLYLRLWRSLPPVEGSRLETVNVVGPLNIAHSGREAVVRFNSDVVSNGIFYTDDNGFDNIQRQRNLTGRPGDADAGVALAGNFYPVVTRITLKNTNASNPSSLSVLSSTSHAGSSVADGSMELMVARRCRLDDMRGVGEPLNDSHVVPQSLWVVLDGSSGIARLQHRNLQELNFPVQVRFGVAVKPIYKASQWTEIFSPVTMSAVDLPEQIHLLTFKTRSAKRPQLVLRLFHMFAVGEDESLSQPATVDLKMLLGPMGVAFKSIDETTGTLNPVLQSNIPTSVTLTPKQIRTFVVNF